MQYFIKFHATGNVEFLPQDNFEDAFCYVESRYGTGWRNLCSIFMYREIAA